MDQSEFDKFAQEYSTLHASNIKASGEGPEFFAEYKVRDVLDLMVASNSDIQSLKILDFGAGIGNSIPFFNKHFPDAKITCVDVSQKSLAIAAQRFGELADYQLFDGTVIPFNDETFDVVFTACVFHHIPEKQHRPLFDEIFRVLKSNGRFVLFEHNPRNPLTRKAVDECPFDENAVLINANTMSKRIESARFGQINIAYRIFFPKALKLLRRFERRLVRIPFGAQYYIEAKKKRD